MLKRVLVLAALLISIPVSVYASTEKCHELVMSYVLHDQDKPTEPGDKFYSEYDTTAPVLMETTGYYHGQYGSHGDKMREGYAAGSPEMYGAVVMIYEAVEQEDGSYMIGEYLDTLEIKDTGYGYSTGKGKSRVRTDKKYQGTIEGGVHLDVYKPNLSGCKEWMKRTNGKIFALIVEGKG